jgi:hypothetical protein
MIGFISTSVTISVNYNQYSAIADLHTFQFTFAHALEFSVSTSRLLVMDFNTGTITWNDSQVFFGQILQCQFSLKFAVRLELPGPNSQLDWTQLSSII